MKEKTHYPEDAGEKALRLLEHMDRTEKGLKNRLMQAGYSEEETQDALDYVKGYGYVDDFRYAQNYILNRIRSKSRKKIYQELMQKGVDRGIIDNAWEEAAAIEPPDEHALLISEVSKKHAPGSEIDEKELRRLYGYLARRGFRSGEIGSALEELEIKFVKNFNNSL